MLLSICVPSYNRGHRAFELVMKLLSMNYGEEIEIICSNNGSDKNVEGYRKLKEIVDGRFRYFEFSENKGYVGNVNQVIKMSRAKFCLLLSDEDMVVEPNLDFYIRLLREYPQLAIVKSRTSKMYNHLKDCYEDAGKKAIKAFYMNGNYVSGVIYNRSIITDGVIDEYAQRYKENIAYRYYPHMFYDAYALIHGDFASSEVWLVDEGTAELDLMVAKNGPNTPIAVYGTWESRLAQMNGFAEQIYDMEVAPDIKFQMFIQLCEKTSFLVNLHRDKYIKDGYDWKKIMYRVSEEMKSVLKCVGLPIQTDEVEVIHEYIDSITVCAD